MRTGFSTVRATVLVACGVALAADSGRSQTAAESALPGVAAPALLERVRLDVHTSPESLTVGDPLTLELRVETPDGIEVRFPNRVADGGPVEFVGVEVAVPEKRSASQVWVARYTLAAYEPGEIMLPPWPVEIRRDSLYAVARTDSIPLYVESVLDDSLLAAGLRDLKPQASLALSKGPWIVAAAALLALAVLSWWWWRRRRRPRAEVVSIARLRPAHEVALETLRRLEAQHLPLDGKFEAYYVRLSEILRRYLEDGFGVAALEQTTEEILFDLDQHLFDRTTIRQVQALCNEWDLVKFARLEPTIEECVQSLQHTRDFVLATAARGSRGPEDGTAATPTAAAMGASRPSAPTGSTGEVRA